MTDEITLFDRVLLRRRRARTAANFQEFDFLHREVAERLAERLEDIRREFPEALVLGSRGPIPTDSLKNRGSIKSLVRSDLCVESLAAPNETSPTLVLDEELLPFAPASFDLVFSCLDLHWVNDLPGALIQINSILRPDGLLLAAFFGGSTLNELRHCLLEAESEVSGGAGLRVPPFVDLRDAAGLMQRAGFALPVADFDSIEVSYPDVFKLLADLRGMGEANILKNRATTALSRATLHRLAELYHERYQRPDGKIKATFEVIFLTGWAPAESQPKPLAPGSARAKLSDALSLTPEETPASSQQEKNKRG